MRFFGKLAAHFSIFNHGHPDPVFNAVKRIKELAFGEDRCMLWLHQSIDANHGCIADSANNAIKCLSQAHVLKLSRVIKEGQNNSLGDYPVASTITKYTLFHHLRTRRAGTTGESGRL